MKIRHYEYIDQLVVKAKSGDDESLLKIIDFYQPLLKTSVRYCTTRYPASYPYCEDIEADLFLIMRELVAQYNAELSFFSYFLSTRIDYALQTHVRRNYLDVSNGGKRPKEIYIEDMPEDWEPFVEHDPAGKIIGGADLATALAQIDVKQREAIQMYYFDGLNQQQAADLLEITQPSFSKRLNRALESLKLLIDDFEENVYHKGII